MASDTVQIDYRKHSRNLDYGNSKYSEHIDNESSVLKTLAFGFGNTFVLENGYVVMFITNVYSTYRFRLEGRYTREKPSPSDTFELKSDGSYFIRTKYINESKPDCNYNSIIICIPDEGGENFKTTRFEPVNRETDRHEASTLSAKNAKIRIREEGISIDMYIRVRNENYVNPVKNPVKESEVEKWNQLEYENAISKLSKTYNFSINKNEVVYYGNDLIRKK